LPRHRSVRRRSTAEAADGCHRPLPANVLKATVTRVRGREGLQTPESGGAGDKGGSSAGGTWLQNACNHTLTKIGQFHSAGATLRCDADWSPKVAKGRAICSRLLSPPPSRFRSFRRWSRVIAAQAIVQIPRWVFHGRNSEGSNEPFSADGFGVRRATGTVATGTRPDHIHRL